MCVHSFVGDGEELKEDCDDDDADTAGLVGGSLGEHWREGDDGAEREQEGEALVGRAGEWWNDVVGDDEREVEHEADVVEIVDA